jgi:HJR/Mrr/RecB family endonuclease
MASKPIRTDEKWIKEQIQLLVISSGVNKANFEQVKALVVATMVNRIIPNQMREYSMTMTGAIERQVRHAGWFGRGPVERHWSEKFKVKQAEMVEIARKEIDKVFRQLKKEEFSGASAYWSIEPKDSWQPLASRPVSPTGAMSPREAEEFVTQTMLYLGANGAKTTQFTQDDGIDCHSDLFIVQVKHLASPVGVATIRETFAVGVAKGKQPIVFAKSGFTQGAKKFAIEYHVLLFTYLPLLVGETYSSKSVLKIGLAKVPTKPGDGERQTELMYMPSNRSAKSDEAYKAYRSRQRGW